MTRCYNYFFIRFIKLFIPENKTIYSINSKLFFNELKASSVTYSTENDLCPEVKQYEYILINNVESIHDIIFLLNRIKLNCDRSTRLILVTQNYFWYSLKSLLNWVFLKKKNCSHHWLSQSDISHFAELTDYEVISGHKRFAGLFSLTVLRAKLPPLINPSISIVVPCKNEKGTIEDAIKRIPDFGVNVEIIFGDDKSTDGTREKITEMIQKYPDKKIILVDSPGISKANNLWNCFEVATNDILIILDADLTVLPEELIYFYQAIAFDKGEFINGSRLVYRMENEAMEVLNTLGNKIFAFLFSFILSTRIKDTLCGTKVFWREDYLKIKKFRDYWGVEDKWGDFELLFGASKCHLKIIEVPVHYMDRKYGVTKMTNRLRNGLRMFRMCLVAFKEFKFSY